MQQINRLGKISRSWVVGALATVMIVMGNPGTADAQQITGNIGFAGNFTPADNSFAATSLASATAITWGNSGQAIVLDATGSFFSDPLITPYASFATLTNFVFNPLASVGATLWQAGGFSFALNSISILTQNSQTLSLVGNGIISGTGYDDTFGTWNFTGNPTSGSSFNFSAGGPAVAAVPEPEIYAMMGIGLGVLGWAARRKKRREASVA